MPHLKLRAAARLLALALPLTACGDDGPIATTAATADPSTTADSTTPGSTSETGGADTTDTTATAGTSATATTDSSTTTATTTADTTADTTATTTDTSDTTSDTDSTTGDPGTPCIKDSDCVLINDCCQCDPKGVDEPVAECDLNCLQSTCDAVGLSQAAAVCHWGVCTFEKTLCNPLGITCKALQPDCSPGTVASVNDIDGMKCWTGACVPAEACDWAPDCATCAAVPGLTCVARLQKGAYVLCEPTPPACAEQQADCACAEVICESSPPHTVCHDQPDGIACECPFC